MDDKKQPKKLDPNGRQYKGEEAELAFSYCPTIYPCVECGHPVIKGYCCTTCGCVNPSGAK